MKIEIRKGKHYDDSGAIEQVLTCTLIGGQWVAGFVAGTTPNPWIDITADVTEETSEALEIVLKKGQNGQLVREKGGTSSLDVVGESKEIILDWISYTPCSELNYWEVQITDECGIVFTEFEIRPDNIELSQYDPECAINFPLKERDKDKNFLARTSIMDNWQNWFKEGKDFHTVEVCVHNTPIQHGINVGLNMFLNGFGSLPGVPGVGIPAFVAGIAGYDADEELDINMGFGNFMPTPLVNEVLDNFCGKVGWTCTSPFHSGDLEMDAVFIPYAGDFNINRLSCTSANEKFKFNNVVIQSAEDFIIQLCKMYNMSYELNSFTKELTLSFNKDKNLTPTTFGLLEDDVLDHKKIIQPNKRKASTEYGYSMDSGDQKSNTMQRVYNSTVSNTNNVQNPLFEGIERNKTDFAPLGFWGDGFGLDYLSDIPDRGKTICVILCAIIFLIASINIVTSAIPAISVGAGFSGPVVSTETPASIGVKVAFWVAIALFATTGAINAFVQAGQIRDDYAYDSCHEGAVQLYGTGQKSNISIIRLESGRALNDAKVVSVPVGSIAVNPKYNTSIPPVTWVGQWSTTAGYAKTKAFNYPLYYDENYFGNLYDTYYEQTQNISYLGASNYLVEVVLVACCDYLQFFGFDNESNRKEGKAISWTYKGVNYKGEVQEVKYSTKANELMFTAKLFR